MIANLFKFKRKSEETVALIPEGKRVYAVGDIHGRFDLFQDLMFKIRDDSEARGKMDTTVVLLGDLIDRGPASFQVVDFAKNLKRDADDLRILSGNHEEVFLRAVKGDSRATRFLIRIGGKSTVLSYGITEAEYDAVDFEELTTLLTERVPQSHIDFLESFEDMIEIGDYVFVHAGIRPEVGLADQKPSDMRWIREEFLNYSGNFGRIIVHGHTITDEIEYMPNRIGIDTGAYASGVLSAIGLEGSDRWAIQTSEI